MKRVLLISNLLLSGASGHAIASPHARQPFDATTTTALCSDEETAAYIELTTFLLSKEDRAVVNQAEAALRSQDVKQIEAFMRGGNLGIIKDTDVWWFFYAAVHVALEYIRHPLCKERNTDLLGRGPDPFWQKNTIQLECRLTTSSTVAASAYLRRRLNRKGGYHCEE